MRYSRKGMKRTTKLQVTVLPAGNRGRNKRGTCAHKATRAANALTPAEMLLTGYAPTPVTAYRPTLAKVRGTAANRG